MQNIDWDIFRFVVAVADKGSAVSAAQSLGVNASTVLRKIGKFEEENGIRLFERRQTGYSPTVECAAVVEAARQIEQSVASISRDILGRDLRLEGRVTVTTTDSLLNSVLAPHISAFSRRNPRIQIEVSVTNTRLNLTRHDADVAIRATNRPPDALVGQRVADLAFAIYGTPEMVAGLPVKARSHDFGDLNWVGIGDALAGWLVAQGECSGLGDRRYSRHLCLRSGLCCRRGRVGRDAVLPWRSDNAIAADWQTNPGDANRAMDSNPSGCARRSACEGL